jgi:hypothetical protein
MAAIKGRDSRKGKHGRGEKIANLFQGITCCACGNPMSYQLSRGREGKYHYEILRCTGKRNNTCNQPKGDYRYDEKAILIAFMDQRWDQYFNRAGDSSEKRRLRSTILGLEKRHSKQLANAAGSMQQAEDAMSSGRLTVDGANLYAKLQKKAAAQADSIAAELQEVRAELKALEAKPSGADLRRQIKEQAQQFLGGDRENIAERRKFNNWLLGLGVRLTITDPKLGRMQWGTVDAIVYSTRDGGVVIDQTLQDLELFGAPAEVIDARQERINLERKRDS